MSNRFDGRTVVVTGGGGGIGAALCRGFATEGARVAVLDQTKASADAVAHQNRGAHVFKFFDQFSVLFGRQRR
ncbi:MAG: SDR family NAD(P)-dependent oxidoreductase [Ilumatobacter sp.]|nr:SDR family NAD(P)-dependent oxidoreductase [Ilumatobacter sp.]